MKVLFFSYDAPNHISGVDSWLKRILPELITRGVDVSIAFITKGNASEFKKVQYFKSLNIDTYTIPVEKYPYAEKKTAVVLKLISEIAPDIVVPGYVLAAINTIKYLKEANILSVAVLHSDDPFYEAMTSVFIEKESAWNFDAVVGVSQFLTTQVKSRMPVGASVPVWQIPYGVRVYEDTAVFSEPLRLIYVGRLDDEQKRITDLTKAFCEVTNRYSGITADIYGLGDLKDKVIEIIKEYGNNKVTYKGYLDSERAASVLSQYHVFVLLSDYEGLPVALLEGMSCGLVPVCLNIKSGITDVIDHMKNGIIVHDRGESFFSAIDILKNKALWGTLSSNSRRTVDAGYSIQVATDKWFQLFNHLIANRQGQPRKITIPDKIVLPETHPDLVWENYYLPDIFTRASKWIRRKLNSR